MNIRDMHIEINQNLQQVASNVTRKFLIDEIDWNINKNINRYIQILIGKNRLGFEDNQINIDSIRPLIVANVNLPLYKYIDNISSVGISKITKYYTVLPPDYSYLVSDGTYVLEKCKYNIYDKLINYNEIYIELTLSKKTQPPYYQSFILKIKDITLNIPNDLPLYNNYSGYSNKNDISFLNDFILKYFKNRGIDLYWERYGNTYKPNTYIFISDTFNITDYSLVIDGIDVTNVTYINKIREQAATLDNVDYLNTLQLNLLTKSSDINSVLTTAYYRPSYINPVSQLTNQILFVYSDITFSPTMVNITYIRKPSVVSLPLGVDCDLAPEFHFTILDKTVEYLKGILKDPEGYQIANADINKSVVI